MNGNGSWPLTCYYLGVTEGTRTPDTRDHNKAPAPRADPLADVGAGQRRRTDTP